MHANTRGRVLSRTVFCLFLSAALLGAFSCGLGEPAESPWPKSIQVYFSEPGISPATGINRGMPERVGAMIRSAKKSVDINIYELSVPAIYNAVIDMHRRGIKVRMVGDINNTHYVGYQALMDARVPMCLGNPDKIMHNKFVVVDREKVSMGSMNYTPSGALLNNENVVFIQNKDVAEYYTKEMDNMFDLGLFGLEKVPFEDFTENEFEIDGGWANGGADVEVYFTPYVGAFGPNYSANDRLLKAISDANHTIHFAVFAFTSIPVAEALIEKAKEGVRVYGVFDKGWHEASVWSTHQLLLDAGINVRMDGNENYNPHNPYSGSKIHDKIMIFDAGYEEGTVFTGSFNFSPSAAIQGNDENCIFLKNKAISIRYRDEVEKLYNRGSHPSKTLGGDEAKFFDVVISEVNWAGSRGDPGNTSPAGTMFRDDKFVELRNLTGKAINISGWQLLGTVSTTYRMVGTIFPKGTIIPPHGYHVLGYSPELSAYDWTATENGSWTPFMYLGTMHDSAKQNFIYLVLKDVEQNFIDIAGRLKAAPFFGLQGSKYASMQRKALDGTLPASWSTATNAGRAVKGPTSNADGTKNNDGYKTNTLADPGGDKPDFETLRPNQNVE